MPRALMTALGITVGALIALAVGLYVVARPAHAREYDVTWFEQNPQARASWIQECRNDVRLSRGGICANADRAEQRIYERNMARRGGLESLSPITRDAVGIACAQPPGQRGLLGVYCRKT